jgi:enoyl-CoA hydratase/carnithine racemase
MTDDLRVEREGPIAVLTFYRPDADIRQFLDFKTAEDALDYEARLTRVLSKLAGMKKPTTAMLQGDAIGGGLFIALAWPRSHREISTI